MKFRSRITREGLILFQGLISTLGKLSEVATILLDREFLRCAIISEGNLESARGYLELAVSSLFGDYRIESQSNNTIAFEVNLSLFTKALNSGKFSSHCVIKLVKRQDKPCLSLEFNGAESVMFVDVCHDIPIKLIRIADLPNITPPQISPPSVALTLPKGKLFKTIIERLTKFSKTLSLTAFQNGRLKLKVEQSCVAVQTYFQGLTPKYIGTLQPNIHATNQTTICVNLKRFGSILDFHLVNYSEATLCKKYIPFLLTNKLRVYIIKF